MREKLEVSAAVDEAKMWMLLNDDLGLFTELLEIFEEDLPRMMANLKAAVDSATMQEVQNAAHALKGCLMTLAADSSAATASTLELKGKTNQSAGMSGLYRRLENELEHVKAALHLILATKA